MRSIEIATLTISRMLLFVTVLLAAGVAMPTEKPRVAISGYDPIAYFSEGQARKGDANLFFEWDGARYQFATPQHRDTFAANPARYAPQYGGYCTIGLAGGTKIEPDPSRWVISDGRLYLFGSRNGPNQFATEHNKLKKQADANWSQREKLR